MPKSPILGGFSTARSPNAADNDAVNLSLEITETKDGKVPGFLFGTSGLDLIFPVGSGPIRPGGLLPLNGTLYVVSGPEVWSVTPNGVKTLAGLIGAGTTPVSMFQNKRQLMIVDGVGGWIVPGGFPLTAGTIFSGGGLYAVGDTITLLAASGIQNAFPVLLVTAIANNPVLTFTLPNAGTTYATSTNVATTNIQPQPGHGSGLTINIGAVTGGQITTAALGTGGTGYAVNDTGIVLTGSQDAVYRVTGVSGGVVTTFILINRGSAYAVTAAASTSAVPGDLPVNVGTGFTVDITAAGPITGSVVHTGGQDYVIGATGLISGGTGDATYLVHTVGPVGSVTVFSIQQGGAIDTPTTSFTQKSTTGSGQNFALISPTFGAFVGLVPVTLPFPNPVKGDISDGFGLLVFLNQQNIAASDEEDLSTWDPLSFGVANQSPDNCISIAVIHDEVFVPKENNTEVWIDQGNANFAFGPITSVHIEFGCVAPFSVAKAGSELIWLSRNDEGEGIVVEAKGYTVAPISTQALVNEFQKYSNLGDAIAYARQEGQHLYYVLTFPEANVTWQYDKTSSELLGYPIWTKLAAFLNGDLNRHWGNAFTPWRGSRSPTTVTTTYQPHGVTITSPTELENTSVVGLPLSLPSILLSLWLDLPDSSGAGIIFTNQDDITLATTNPGLFIQIQNDTQGSPQVTVKAWDAANAAILQATYDFTTWSQWVNVQISLDTVTNQIGVYANTTIAGVPTETPLSGSVSWSSTNPIGNPPGHNWRVVPVT